MQSTSQSAARQGSEESSQSSAPTSTLHSQTHAHNEATPAQSTDTPVAFPIYFRAPANSYGEQTAPKVNLGIEDWAAVRAALADADQASEKYEHPLVEAMILESGETIETEERIGGDFVKADRDEEFNTLVRATRAREWIPHPMAGAYKQLAAHAVEYGEVNKTRPWSLAAPVTRPRT
ncbi:hypothetical protein ACLMJK_001380 [Lecanora helva]